MQARETVQQPDGSATDGRARSILRRILHRRLWLPRTLYAAIPWIYLGAGAGSLLGGLFLPETAWIVPYLILLGLVLSHAAASVASMRHRFRKRH